ncbi:DUF3825 domain-containing protein [Paenibacillus sp. CMAA1364]
MKVYKSLFKRFKEQPVDEVFASFPFNGKNGETWEKPFEQLAVMAKSENWDFSSDDLKRDYNNQEYPILTNYLSYTFIRVQELNLIAFSDDGDKACFNTGLQNRDDQDIFATFFRNKEAKKYNAADWTFYTFAESYSNKLKPFGPLPDIATYISDPTELIFDLNYGDGQIEVNYKHIIDENSERLPDALKSNDRLALTALKGAIESLKDRIRRNYKVAIPHWYEGEIQLLLPLNLLSDTRADIALVISKDKERKIYRAKTILTMDMAYIDARLITAPDRDWLNP